MIDIAENLARVLDRVRAAARQAGRDPESVQLVAVAKTQPVEVVREAVAAGAQIIGENYVQEARGKIAALGRAVCWHLVGHLQRNKAREAAELFDLIETVDSVRLAHALDRVGRERGRPVRVLVEVNTGREASKGGVAPEALPALVESLGPCEGIEVDGLMTIPPPSADPEAARPFFRLLRQLRDQLASRTPANVHLRELSMGMSDDFPVAIAEGATIIRVGRAIFGDRAPAGEEAQ